MEAPLAIQRVGTWLRDHLLPRRKEFVKERFGNMARDRIGKWATPSYPIPQMGRYSRPKRCLVPLMHEMSEGPRRQAQAIHLAQDRLWKWATPSYPIPQMGRYSRPKRCLVPLMHEMSECPRRQAQGIHLAQATEMENPIHTPTFWEAHPKLDRKNDV